MWATTDAISQYNRCMTGDAWNPSDDENGDDLAMIFVAVNPTSVPSECFSRSNPHDTSVNFGRNRGSKINDFTPALRPFAAIIYLGLEQL